VIFLKAKEILRLSNIVGLEHVIKETLGPTRLSGKPYPCFLEKS